MPEALTPAALRSAVGISPSYASMILAGERSPGRPLAIRIFRATGHRFGPIVGLSDTDIDTLERIEARPTPTSTEIAA